MSDQIVAEVSTTPIVAESVGQDVPELPSNPTGEQARAYVEALKAKGQPFIPKVEKQKEETIDTEGMTKAEAREEIRKHKVKVNGEELEVDENELKRGYSHQRAANKILQEGKQAKKQAEQFIQMMKDKGQVFEVLKKLGHDPRLLSEEYLVSQLEEEVMDPRDKELRDARRRIKEIEDHEQRQQEEVERSRHEDLKRQYAEDYNQQFIQALQDTNLPPTKPMVAEMARYISRSAKIGFKMTAMEAAKLVREDVLKSHQRLIGDSDGETLMSLLGPDTANKIRKYDTAKLKNPESYLKTPTEQGEKRKQNVSTGRMSPLEWARFKRGL